MVLGIRASYHDAQIASSETSRGRPPVCPCAACFDREGHEQLRAACRSPAKELRIPRGSRMSNPFSRLTGSGGNKHGLGVSLGRRLSGQSMASVASARPLRTAAQDVPQAGGDVESVVDKKL